MPKKSTNSTQPIGQRTAVLLQAQARRADGRMSCTCSLCKPLAKVTFRHHSALLRACSTSVIEQSESCKHPDSDARGVHCDLGKHHSQTRSQRVHVLLQHIQLRVECTATVSSDTDAARGSHSKGCHACAVFQDCRLQPQSTTARCYGQPVKSQAPYVTPSSKPAWASHTRCGRGHCQAVCSARATPAFHHDASSQ